MTFNALECIGAPRGGYRPIVAGCSALVSLMVFVGCLRQRDGCLSNWRALSVLRGGGAETRVCWRMTPVVCANSNNLPPEPIRVLETLFEFET